MDLINELKDRLAIEELFARYAHTVDGYDGPGWVNCFTADGIFEVMGEDGTGVQFAGHDALNRFVEAHIRLLPGTRHVMSNHLIEFDSETVAEHVCTLSGTLSRPESVYVFANGYYRSRVECQDGAWKIRHRRVYLDNVETLGTEPLASHMQPMMGWIAENGTPS